MKTFRIRKTAVLGLTLVACSAFAQFSTVSSRAAMNANDTLTWNQLGYGGWVGAFAATSTRGVQVTGSQPGGSQAFSVVTGFELGGYGFQSDDIVLSFGNSGPVILNFNPPVTAVGMNVAGGTYTPLSFSGVILAYRGSALLGTLSGSGEIPFPDSTSAPFWGVRDEGGISQIVIDLSACGFYCNSTVINQLSLVTPQRVSVDVKPGADKSVLVADSNAKLPFAILSAPGFDASTAVDISSLRFGRTGTEASVLSCAGGVDVNYDFLPDLTCQFSVKAGAFVVGDLTAKLKGKLTNGNTIYGTADVIVK